MISHDTKYFQSKYNALAGSDYGETVGAVWRIYNDIRRRTNRKPYVRSRYFKKSKVFIDSFWQHLNQKSHSDRVRRLKYFACGIDLLRNSCQIPESRPNPNGRNEIVHRFAGKTKNGQIFYVQVRESRRGDRYLMSVFPDTK
ncbi:MAG: hypothetical protein LBC95_03510 [Candidatus Nomurabacteria bacterium]|jgi:hypothetical protein|nr:hypothetical protein [Candidatus Nomurabacteria bacterium]